MLGDKCSHGVRWGDECHECELIMARETVRHFGSAVDEARALIAQAEQEEEMKG